VDDLIAFVRQQLDDDERKIDFMEREEHRVRTAPIFQSHPPTWLTGVDIFVSSKRWRAEVEAKRRILDWAVRAIQVTDADCYQLAVEDVVYLLAQPYAGRPGWREDWQVATR
jgi:hypothetical protein